MHPQIELKEEETYQNRRQMGDEDKPQFENAKNELKKIRVNYQR